MTRSWYFPISLCAICLLFTSLGLADSTVQGVVKDNVGNGMEDVIVQVVAGGSTHTVKTDSEGRYAISGLPAGVCTVTFEADRYVTVNRKITVPASGAVSVDVTMNAEETVGVRTGLDRRAEGLAGPVNSAYSETR